MQTTASPVFQLAVDDQRRVLVELWIDDLALEVGLAGEVTEAGEIPGDVVGQEREDARLVAAPKALHVGVDDVGVRAHGVLLGMRLQRWRRPQ